MKIGVFAMSDDSTQFYLNELEKIGKIVSVEVFNSDFESINNLLPKPNAELKNILKPKLQQISDSDIQQIIIPNITIHETIDEIQKEEHYSLNVIHPIKETIQKLKDSEVDKIMVLGSYYTMQKSFVSNAFQENGITVSFPNQTDIEQIDSIRKLVYQRKHSQKEIEKFNGLVNQYAENTTIVIACTELSIILNLDLENVCDMARIPIEKVESLC